MNLLCDVLPRPRQIQPCVTLYGQKKFCQPHLLAKWNLPKVFTILIFLVSLRKTYLWIISQTIFFLDWREQLIRLSWSTDRVHISEIIKLFSTFSVLHLVNWIHVCLLIIICRIDTISSFLSFMCFYFFALLFQCNFMD